MKGGEILLAVAAKEFYVAQRLGVFVFNGKTAVSVLNIVGCGYDVIGDFEKIRFISAVRTFEQVAYSRLMKLHRRWPYLCLLLHQRIIGLQLFQL